MAELLTSSGMLPASSWCCSHTPSKSTSQREARQAASFVVVVPSSSPANPVMTGETTSPFGAQQQQKAPGIQQRSRDPPLCHLPLLGCRCDGLQCHPLR